MTVVLPQETRTQIGLTGARADGDVPVLYLLHGLSDDHTIWQRRTSVERYAAPLGIAVVMPAVHRSFYADERHGHRYWTFLSSELPQVVSSFFRVSEQRERTYVAGLSMGGYGALKWALREPGRFAGAASMSGALDLAGMSQDPGLAPLFERVFGDEIGPQDDVFSLLRAGDVSRLPPLHVSCGTQDELLAANERFIREATDVGADVTVDLRPGDHEWEFWDVEIQKVLAWLPGL
jgi:S-formylglutathione hydrolase FrmB